MPVLYTILLAHWNRRSHSGRWAGSGATAALQYIQMRIQNSGALEGQQQQKQETTAEMEWHKQWGQGSSGRGGSSNISWSRAPARAASCFTRSILAMCMEIWLLSQPRMAEVPSSMTLQMYSGNDWSAPVLPTIFPAWWTTAWDWQVAGIIGLFPRSVL